MCCERRDQLGTREGASGRVLAPVDVQLVVAIYGILGCVDALLSGGVDVVQHPCGVRPRQHVLADEGQAVDVGQLFGEACDLSGVTLLDGGVEVPLHRSDVLHLGLVEHLDLTAIEDGVDEGHLTSVGSLKELQGCLLGLPGGCGEVSGHGCLGLLHGGCDGLSGLGTVWEEDLHVLKERLLGFLGQGLFHAAVDGASGGLCRRVLGGVHDRVDTLAGGVHGTVSTQQLTDLDLLCHLG